MHGDFTKSANDLLKRYLGADERDADRVLEALVEQFAQPVIMRTLRAKIRILGGNRFFGAIQDIDDIYGDTCLRLIARLNRMRHGLQSEPIDDFENYTAVIAINSLQDFMKLNSPRRVRLRNRIRYVLEKSERFVVVTEGGERFAALVEFSDIKSPFGTDELVGRLRADWRRDQTLEKTVGDVLKAADGRVGIRDLTRIIAELDGIEDRPDVGLDEPVANLALSVGDASAAVERRAELEMLWAEIVQLPSRQRLALLYNLVDERRREMLFMFFNARVANLGQIADALETDIEECAKLLPRLPFEDKNIAEMMSLTPKQVANLRKVARDNLRRRMSGTPRRRRRSEIE